MHCRVISQNVFLALISASVFWEQGEICNFFHVPQRTDLPINHTKKKRCWWGWVALYHGENNRGFHFHDSICVFHCSATYWQILVWRLWTRVFRKGLKIGFFLESVWLNILHCQVIKKCSNFRMHNRTENDSLWDLGEEQLLMITWILEGILLPIVGVVGVVGNAISLVVIHKVSFRPLWLSTDPIQTNQPL